MTNTVLNVSPAADSPRLPASRSGFALEADVTGFYDAATGSVQYVVADPITQRCAIVDPVLDFDPKSGSTGTASADQLLRLPGGDARQLWRSIQQILQLPADMRLFTGHDYRPNGREARWQSTVAEQKAYNAQLKGSDETRFVRFRTERDRTLPLPDLMLAALQVNIAGGRLPAPEADGRRYLKMPLNAFL
jgi:glyoxylase-like metal-dependent hydrolase (beta-lactamase superfamily II)